MDNVANEENMSEMNHRDKYKTTSHSFSLEKERALNELYPLTKFKIGKEK